MRSRQALATMLFLTLFPGVALHAQQDGAMDKEQSGMQDRSGMTMGKPAARGTLAGVGGHKVTGTVHLVNENGKRHLHVTSDFSVEKGPDVYLTLTNGPRPVDGASLMVARLTRFTGEQSFELPANADLSKYSHVVLWSTKNRRSVGQAKLDPAAMEMMGKGDEGAMMGKDEGAMMEKDEGAR
jgi:hypothetical protein